MRFPALAFVVLFVVPALDLRAQSTNASLTGAVTDQSKALIANAQVAATSANTGTEYDASTGASGVYNLPNLPPGPYRLKVEKSGFKTLIRPDVILHVQDVLSLNFMMQVGSTSETIRVDPGAPLLGREAAAVSTLIENRFVENLPLNGRSFGSLLDLIPGVVLVPTAAFYEQGQFSVNGQRPDANYFMVDGVSANLGTPGASFGQGGTGQLPATSAFGGMSNLVSLDALQEFRVQTSTFAPEFGRQPGAQISVVTKSGTNRFSGTVFEYLRNDLFDANDWFANNKGLAKPALRQNDFGGVFGAPIQQDKLFFFGSYEGLRVRQPQIANTFEPSLAARQSAPSAIQPLLNAFPKPNGPDLGGGTAAFAAGYSDPSSLDSYSGRVDSIVSPRLSFFARYSDAPSSLIQRAGLSFNYSTLLHTKDRTQALTLGADQTIASHAVNEFRFNHSLSQGHSFLTLDDFGGAIPLSSSELFPTGQSLSRSLFTFQVGLIPFGISFDVGPIANTLQHQINVTDNLSWMAANHQLKFGIDFRRLNPEEKPNTYQQAFYFDALTDVLANSATQVNVNSATPDVQLVTYNVSLFAQDTWKFRKLTAIYGMRWEYNTAPTSPNGTPPFTVTQVTNLATTALAPEGTALWHAQKSDFAPRFGLAWQPTSNLVMRAGVGVFYDLGYADITNAISSFPYVQQRSFFGGSFPLTGSSAAPPPFTTRPPVPSISVVDPNHVLPRTFEWNVATEQSFGGNDVLGLTYVGAVGRKLMRRDIYYAPNPDFTYRFDVQRNAGTSSYNALQVQYRHRLSHGLQSLLSYTWSHSLDDVSSDGDIENVPLAESNGSGERGPSDYDVRSTFSAAISYDIPRPESGLLKQIFAGWSTDSIIYSRSAPPVNVVTGNNPFPYVSLSGANSVQRPDVVPGAPLYLHPPGAPGRKVINSAAFSAPVPASAQGNLGRNALRSFGATQWDLTLRRQFRFHDHLSLQARGDFFNTLNHPNFGAPVNYLTSPQFGEATQTLNNYLGGGGQNGGLSPLYQIGGPRSTQLALKLQF
jgi:Carboxypeptidase regulatory-like domain